MGDLLHLRDAHEQAQMLLPWRVNDTLEPGEATWFEAHLAQCAECRADLAANLALRERYAQLPVEMEAVRSPLVDQLADGPSVVSWKLLRRRVTLGWALAAQAAVAAAAAVALFVAMPSAPERDYNLLGSEAAEEAGNAIVLFAPETTERELRAALNAVRARVVDGPTASGAYVVRVSDNRAAALDRLRAVPQVVLAEPIDAGGAP
ncbi:MAG TPA: zf-HC2 domain-containing protein [Croceibacterium sp.]|nr:zf-HC2 domain-containing protein [Croceibacterium sp.]